MPPSIDPSPAGIVRRLAAGIGAQGLSQVLLVLGQFVAVPAFLAGWGTETYAEWLVLSAAAGLLVLADLGVSGHLGNGMRAAWACGDGDAGRWILQTGLGVYGVLTAGAALAVAMAAVSLDLPAKLGVTKLEDATTTFLLLGATSVVLLPRGLVASVHSARGCFHREVMGLALVQCSLTAAACLTALAGGRPVDAAMAQLAVALAVGWGVLLWELRRRYDDVPLRPLRPTAAEFRILARKAPLYAVQQGGVAILLHVPVILLGRVANPADVVLFTNMRTFTGVVRQTARQVATSIGLEMARMHARDDRAQARELYLGSTPLLGGGVALVAGAAWALGPFVFTVWTHGAIRFDPPTAAAFLAGALLQVPAYGAVGFLRYVDRPEFAAMAQTAEIVATILLGLLLIPLAGAPGAALAVTLAETLATTPWHVGAAGRLLDLAVLRPSVRAYAVSGIAFILALLASFAADRMAPLATPAGIATFATLWSAVALPMLFLALGAEQRAWVRRRLRQFLRTSR